MNDLYCWKLNDLMYRHICRMVRRGIRIRGTYITSLSTLTLREMQFAIRETLTGDLAYVKR